MNKIFLFVFIYIKTNVGAWKNLVTWSKLWHFGDTFPELKLFFCNIEKRRKKSISIPIAFIYLNI